MATVTCHVLIIHDCDLGEEQQNQPLQAEGLAMLPPTLPPEHGIAAEWPDWFECYCGALVGKEPRDIDHFTIHKVTRPWNPGCVCGADPYQDTPAPVTDSDQPEVNP